MDEDIWSDKEKNLFQLCAAIVERSMGEDSEKLQLVTEKTSWR